MRLRTVAFLNFQNASPLTIAAGGNGTLTLNFPGSTAAATISNTGGNLTISAPVILQSAPAFSTSHAADSITFSGPISGPYGITSIGNGTVALTAANSYQGTTAVNGGTLRIGNANALPASTTLAVGVGSLNALVQFTPGIGASKIAALTMTTGSQIDLADDPLILEPADAPSKSADMTQLANLIALGATAVHGTASAS